MITWGGLRVVTDAGAPVLSGLDLHVPAGEVHALVGESGSGKTTAALALFGLVRPGLAAVDGTVRVAGEEPLALRHGALRRFRRRHLGWLGQDPALALTPHLTLGELLGEVAPRGTSAEDLLAAASELGLGDVPGLLARRPAQLSGGQRRRAAFVRALAAGPDVLVLDEPTNGLDPDAVEQVADTIARVRRRVTVLVITHDLGFARRVADRVSLLDSGQVVGSFAPAELESTDSLPVRRALDAADLADPPRAGDGRGAAVLTASGLHVRTPGGVDVVEGLDLALAERESVALLGPSGSGKSTLVRTLIGVHAPVAGELSLAGRPVPWPLAGRTAEQRRQVQLIGQDPTGSLNPVVPVGRQLAWAVRRARPEWAPDAVRAEVAGLLEAVALPGGVADALPRRLSGGQAQRVAIARALAHEPHVLLCDEATSSLDPGTQRSVLELLVGLRDSRGLALLVITHDRAVARFCAERTLHLGEGGHRWADAAAEHSRVSG